MESNQGIGMTHPCEKCLLFDPGADPLTWECPLAYDGESCEVRQQLKRDEEKENDDDR